jgi:aminoglycoside phosphotransferase (APT) family kinase protein
MCQHTDLTHAEVASFLLSRGLVEPRDVVEGELRISDVSGRNRVYLADVGAGPAYVVKQGDVAHEARVLGALAEPLRGHVPEVVEADDGLLVLRTVSGPDWADHHPERRFPPAQARALGRVLRTLETVELPAGPGSMWGLDVINPPAAVLREFSAGGLEVIARVQGAADLCARLEDIRALRGAEVAVHGDLRWENCVAAGRRLLVVDWEDAGPGPRGWDVACAVAEYLRLWIGSVPIAAADDPGRLLALAGHPLACMRPAIAALWTAFGGRDVERLCELVAVRLLEMAIERSQALSAPSGHVLVLLDLASNLLSRPRAAATQLLGLTP